MSETDTLKIHGDSGPDQKQTRKIVHSQVYALRDWLLLGNPVDCRVAGREMAIGSLPRRILDCKQYLNMQIYDRWKKDKNKFGGEINIKEYYMTPEAVDEFIETKMHLRMPWGEITRKRAGRKKVSPQITLHAV
jgi:hypothetical protein